MAATPQTPETLRTEVMGALLAHPHDDTPDAIRDVLGTAAITREDVLAALEALRAARFAITAGGHWQLSAAGYRALRAGPRTG